MIEYNEASLALYCGKCAWKQEGRQRNWYFRGGRTWDKIIVGVTREDYEELERSSGYWESFGVKEKSLTN
jgi:RimJ/RimL family protein N-acetyltransferase